MSALHPIYVERALAELAEAVVRQEHAKDLRNKEMLVALAEEDAERFKQLWAERYERPWEK